MLHEKQSDECKQSSFDGSSNLNKDHDEQEEIENITEAYEIAGWFIGPTIENEGEIPANSTRKEANSNETKKLLTDRSQRIIILYLHGSEGTRSTKFR